MSLLGYCPVTFYEDVEIGKEINSEDYEKENKHVTFHVLIEILY